MRSVAVFCDRLSWQSAFVLLKARPAVVYVLDSIPSTVSAKCLQWILAMAGCSVKEAEFFAGHIKGANGEPLFMIARQQSSRLALDAAQLMVMGQPILAEINLRAGRDKLVLHMARHVWVALERQLLQMQIARALAQSSDRQLLFLSRPRGFDPGILDRVRETIEVRYYGARLRILDRARLIGWLLAHITRPLVWRWVSMFRHPDEALIDSAHRSGLLLVQEDEVSSDRSYRTQPHWFTETERQPFATYLVKGGPSPIAKSDRISPDVAILDEATLGRVDLSSAGDEVCKRLSLDARRCFFLAVSARNDCEATAYAITARLLSRARLLEKACRHLKIRAFLGSEPYLLDSDAIHIFSSELGIATVAFQYSNVAFANVMTATTADHMLLFSPRYEAMWPYSGIRPERMAATGYPFDAAFNLVRHRAIGWRRQLERAGARFIICYFDENVGPPSKYGFMAQSELDAEIRELAQLVLINHDVGVIFKSQFRKRSPTVRLPADPVLRDAMATGRVIELCVGTHRNIVFPAEAAFASDLAIGHLIGATAALEAALAGMRCLLINLNGTKTANDDLYARGQIVFRSLSEALQATTLFRAGHPAYLPLGDWNSFIHELDPFRDGQASVRLRALLMTLMAPSNLAGDSRPGIHARPADCGTDPAADFPRETLMQQASGRLALLQVSGSSAPHS